MGENVRLLLDVCDYAHLESVPGAILSLDQEKAFDRVEWPFLEKVLVKMGFGPSFRSWVSLLYSSVNSAVIVNGHLTEFFPVTRGVRQGCPLSPLLYVLVAETMACKVREDDHIDGFPLPCSNRRIKVSQYADDTTVLVCSDFSLMALFQLFASYERASGARINLSKCSGLLLGPWRSRDPVSMPIQIKWSTDSIRVLGSLIHPGGEQNWGPLLGKLTTLVDAWKPRHLSFRGRALIMNTLGLSKFWYLGSICSIPFNIIRRINHIIFPFLWNKKREWISRSSLTQPTNQGGLGIVDLHRKLSSLTVLWVKRFLLGADHSWKFFFRYFLRRTMLAEPVERVFTQSNISTATLRTLRSFYQRVIQSWLDIKGNTINSLWVVPRPEPSPNIPLDHLTACIAYRPLTQLQHSPPRCETKYPFIEWSTVWANLNHLRFMRPALDTSWLACHGVLPTADRLLSFGMSVSPMCHCGQRETLTHLFFYCPIAQGLISWFFSVVKQHSHNIPRPTEWEMLYGFRRATAIPHGFTALLGIVRHQIWCARNKHRFEGVVPVTNVVLERIKSSFHFIARVQKRHCNQLYFKSQWLINGVLGTFGSSGAISFVADLDPPSDAFLI